MKAMLRIAAAILFLATPLAGQTFRRDLVVNLYAGGADHLADLAPSGPQASFSPGYSFGASVGLQLTERFAIHSDFTFTRNPAWGASPFSGQDVNRFFYGAHVEYRYPLSIGLAPYGFAGLGAVSIDQLGFDTFRPTTRPAVMYGAGVFYPIPRSRIEVFGEVKGLTYRWNMAGFHRTMFDVAYTAGASYRLPL